MKSFCLRIGTEISSIASCASGTVDRIDSFRPNYILYYHPGPTKEKMEEIGKAVLKTGLEEVWWGCYYPVDMSEPVIEMARLKEPCLLDVD